MSEAGVESAWLLSRWTSRYALDLQAYIRLQRMDTSFCMPFFVCDRKIVMLALIDFSVYACTSPLFCMIRTVPRSMREAGTVPALPVS